MMSKREAMERSELDNETLPPKTANSFFVSFSPFLLFSRSPFLPFSLSSARAWCYLVRLSWRRQARSQQMVWIAVGLLAFAAAWVAIVTAMDKWSMKNDRWPFRQGQTLAQWADGMQEVLSTHEALVRGPGVETALASSLQIIVRQAGFIRFSHWIVFLLFLSFLLPLFNLSFATEALGGERESNSLIWMLSRPISRPAIYLGKFVALLPWTLGLTLGGFVLLCLAAGEAGWLALRLYWPAVLTATLAFSSLFYFMGAFFRRPAVAAIVYAFFLEVMFGNMPGYLKRISIGFYARCMMFDAASAYGIQAEQPEIYLPVDGTTALTVLLGLTIALLGIGTVVFSRSQYQEIV
ncbi:MAG: ABC transporter permease [Gemmataceae bacterium]